ncbi:MAG: hypothetical protein HDS17_01260 [Bacteroides sp.]|nr:hypothetical protein [Bacteroides sp.]
MVTQLNLKLLGVLQDYGTPYASLYFNDNGNGGALYLVLEQGKNDSGDFEAYVMPVSAENIKGYLDKQIDLLTIVKQSPEILLWRRKKNDDGVFSHISSNGLVNKLDDEDFFDPEFCRDAPRINYFITHPNSLATI